MDEDKGLPIDEEATLNVVCEMCLTRIPSALMTGEVTGVNRNELTLTLITDKGEIHTTKVRMSLAKTETEEWLNQIELPR